MCWVWGINQIHNAILERDESKSIYIPVSVDNYTVFLWHPLSTVAGQSSSWMLYRFGFIMFSSVHYSYSSSQLRDYYSFSNRAPIACQFKRPLSNIPRLDKKFTNRAPILAVLSDHYILFLFCLCVCVVLYFPPRLTLHLQLLSILGTLCMELVFY